MAALLMVGRMLSRYMLYRIDHDFIDVTALSQWAPERLAVASLSSEVKRSQRNRLASVRHERKLTAPRARQ